MMTVKNASRACEGSGEAEALNYAGDSNVNRLSERCAE
jgi:hypothetical protein